MGAKKLKNQVEQVEFIELNQTLVTWCVEAVNNTFSSLLGVNPKLKVTINTPQQEKKTHEISGVIGFIQSHIEGTLSLGFSRETVMKLMTNFYNEPITEIDEKLIGGISEMTNIIFGIVKEHYSSSGHPFKMCLPVVVVGKNHTVFSAFSSERLLLEFETEHGPFWLEVMAVNIKKKKGNKII